MNTIMIASRSSQILQSLCEEFEAAGCEVLVADDGNAALALAELRRPSLIVATMDLDRRSSFLLLERLAYSLDYPMPSIVLGHTGRYGERHTRWLQMLGAKILDSSTKPSSVVELGLDLLDDFTEAPSIGHPRIDEAVA